MMLVLGRGLLLGMIMPHEFHHQDVGKRTEQKHAVKQNIA